MTEQASAHPTATEFSASVPSRVAHAYEAEDLESWNPPPRIVKSFVTWLVKATVLFLCLSTIGAATLQSASGDWRPFCEKGSLWIFANITMNAMIGVVVSVVTAALCFLLFQLLPGDVQAWLVPQRDRLTGKVLRSPAVAAVAANPK